MKYLIYFLSFLYISADDSGISKTAWNPRIDECPEWEGICRPTIVPQRNFNAQHDAIKIHKALQNSEFSDLISIIARRTSEERQLIKAAYQEKLDLNLTSCVEEKLRTDIKHLILALLKPLASYYSNELLTSLRTRYYDDTLEVLGTLSNKGLKTVLDVFRNEQTVSFFDTVQRNVVLENPLFDMLYLLHCRMRPENEYGNNSVENDVYKLTKAEGKFITDTKPFIDMIYHRSSVQLRQIYAAFLKETGHSVGKSLTRGSCFNLYGIHEYAHMLYRITNNRTAFFCERLHENIKRLFKYPTGITRILFGRAEIDLGNIKAAYQEKYGISLSDAIQNLFKGAKVADYLKTLLTLLEDPHDNEADKYVD